MNATQTEFLSWAEDEIKRAGLLDADSDYDGMLGRSLLDLARTFTSAGHSGFSASLTATLFAKLAAYEPLTALTSDPGEWMHIEADMAGNATTWQSRRKPSCFSNDGGFTYYDLDDHPARWRRLADALARRTGTHRPWMFAKRHRTQNPLA